MDTPPAVIVHSLIDVERAMAPGLPVLLLSAPGAALYGGCLWWQSLLRAAAFTGPSLLDCADAPGRALEAVRLGVPGVILRCEPEIYQAVAALAAARGILVTGLRPAALDMAARGAARRLPAWLVTGGGDIA